MQAINSSTVPPRPPFWFQLSILWGNLLQLAGLILGAAILYLAAHTRAPGLIRVIELLIGLFFIYICCHAIAHWIVGRLVGIQFRGYGVRGTDHPEAYPQGIRPVISLMPTFTVMSKKASMQSASPTAKALMFGAGETSSSIFSILVGLYAWLSGIPGGLVLFIVMVVFSIFSTYATAANPRGDYAKALHALRAGKSD